MDLIDASRHLTKPMLAWHSFDVTLPIPTWPVTITTKDESLGIANAFTTLPTDVLGFHDLATTISILVHTVSHLNQYYHDGFPQSAIVVLCESRNRSQHYLLSLPSVLRISSSNDRVITPQSGEPFPELQQHLYEIIRLSLLIFNNIVVYPLPPFAGLDTKLARLLKDEINVATTNEPNLHRLHADLLLWAVFLGGISDYHDLNRSWYIEKARGIRRTIPYLRRWPDVESLLNSFVWFNSILNEEGIKFWAEVSHVTNS